MDKTDKKSSYLQLLEVIKKGDIVTLKRLVVDGAKVHSKDEHGWTLLHRAVYNHDSAINDNYLNVCKILLDAGADVNAQNNDGWTPLHIAAEINQVDTCKLLVDYKADRSIKTYVGRTPLDIAKEVNNAAVIEYLSNQK